MRKSTSLCPKEWIYTLCWFLRRENSISSLQREVARFWIEFWPMQSTYTYTHIHQRIPIPVIVMTKLMHVFVLRILIEINYWPCIFTVQVECTSLCIAMHCISFWVGFGLFKFFAEFLHALAIAGSCWKWISWRVCPCRNFSQTPKIRSHSSLESDEILIFNLIQIMFISMCIALPFAIVCTE